MKSNYKRRDFLKLAGSAAFAGFMSSLSFAAEKTKRPNFVFILVDDLGWTDLGCFGSTFYETPNIDKFASESMKFTNAYAAAALCSPTRASIMAGKYPARIDITDWIGGNMDGKLKHADYNMQMALEEVTVAEALNAAGYKTGFVGKWHLGKEKYYPDKQGFDINIGGNHRGYPPSYFSPYKNPTLENGPEGEYLTDRLTKEALEFLDKNKDENFMLHLCFYTVHLPLQAKKDLIEKYEQKAKTLSEPDRKKYVLTGHDLRDHPRGTQKVRQYQDHPLYAAMVETLDNNVGLLLDHIEKLSLSDNTVIFFFSDNGGLSTTGEGAPTSNYPLRSGKGWLYEGGIREPMIVHWPGVTKAGSECHEPVISNDFYPTILEMANLPLKPAQHQDGLSLVPLLKQSEKSLKRKFLCWHYPHYSNQGSSPSSAIRAGDYKLHEFLETGKIELYNLKDDISEQNDLTEKMPSKVQELKVTLHQWRKSVNAQMPKPNPDFVSKIKKSK